LFSWKLHFSSSFLKKILPHLNSAILSQIGGFLVYLQFKFILDA